LAPPNIKRIGKYEVIELLGRGGMGMVYRASDRQLNREVAIKTVTEGLTGDAEMLQRFYHEAAKTGALKHPNIVIVHDLGEQDGFPYIVMEYLSGDPLDRVIQSGRPLALAFKLKIIEQVCYALGYAHRNDVIHRDVKPGNVIVQPDGVTKLLDFGIARQEKSEGHLTRTGHVIGTIQYMAPERLRNEAFDGRSDIFSVGIMMYQLLTGQLPFTGDYSIVQKILAEKHPPLSDFLHNYPPALDVILDRALAKNPDDRYTTADEMASDVSSVADELKKEQVAEWIQQAERLVQQEQYTSARDILLQLLKVDSQNTGARQLMVAVQQNLSSRQRAEQIRQLRSQAEDAASDKRYEEATAYLQEVCRLDPANAELAQLLQTFRQKKSQREQIEKYLREADSARSRGDLETAQAVIARALEVDRDDSRLRAAHVALARLIEEGSRQKKSRQLLDAARNEISARRFTAAMELLAEVERVDASNPELIPLLAAAKSGREQEQRRRILEQLQNEISLATGAEDFTRALDLVEQSLQRMPGEPTLLRFKGELTRQVRDAEVRRRIDETVKRCRELVETSPQAALQLVRDELRELPGNERLLALRASIDLRVLEQSQEKSRARYMAQAHDALSSGDYAGALTLLESCQKEGAFSPEIAELMDFARQEATLQKEQGRIRDLFNRAQELMAIGDYDAVIELLSPVSQDAGTGSLQSFLEEARTQRDAFRRSLDIALQTAELLTREEQYEEAVRFLESQPAAVLQSEPVQTALTRLREACRTESRALQAVAKAYAALDALQIGDTQTSFERLDDDGGEASLLARIVPVFTSRRSSIADKQLASAAEQVRDAIEAGDGMRASQLLKEAAIFHEHASPDVQSRWSSLAKEAGKNKILGRMGRRKS
jgi:eukaryotic-like serine/threonine-protein kinase